MDTAAQNNTAQGQSAPQQPQSPVSPQQTPQNQPMAPEKPIGQPQKPAIPSKPNTTNEFDFKTEEEKNEESPFVAKNDDKKEKRRFSSKNLLLIVTTVLVGVAIPITVFSVKKSQDIRGRAAETTASPYPTFSPTQEPKLSNCGQSCQVHADCIAGFFCSSQDTCKNALCPESINCACE